MAKAIPEMRESIYREAYSNLLEALKVDVKTIVRVALDNGQVILNDRKTQKLIADAVMKEVQKQFKR